MVKTVKFWDKTAEKYEKSPIRNEEAYKEKLEITRGYFTPESRVFEYGCGTGTTAIHHAPHVQQVVATDISSKMIDIAQSKAAKANIDNVDFQCVTLQDFVGEDASFDVVMAHNILHLLADPQKAIEISYRLLKPGGAFVTSTVCLGDSFSHWRILLVLGKLVGMVPYVNVLKRATLESYFKNAGFEIDLEWHRPKQGAFIILKKPA